MKAVKSVESIVRDSCQMKVLHGTKGVPPVQLGAIWEWRGNKDADWVEGTFAAYLRYASVVLELTRAMKHRRMGSLGKTIRIGVLEMANEELCA